MAVLSSLLVAITPRPLVAAVSPARSSTPLARREGRSTVRSSRSLSPSTSFTLVTNGSSSQASYNLPATAMPRVFRTVLLDKKPSLPRYLDSSRVHLDKEVEELGGIFSDEEDSKPPFQQRSSDLYAEFTRSEASLDTLSECLSSRHAVATEGGEGVRALSTLGEVEWKRYFGDVGPAPDLPSDMGIILDSACPFWPGRKVRDTHLLALIPATVDGVPFTLDLLGELIRRPKDGGFRTQYKHHFGVIEGQVGEKSPDRSYWLLMTRDVLQDSRNKEYSVQKSLIASYARKEGRPYEMPGALEAATVVLMHHACTGTRLFGSRNYTRCKEQIDSRCSAIVGSFDSSGLVVGKHIHKNLLVIGVAGCWKVKEDKAFQIFGEMEWKHYFGDVGPVPDLPSNMGAILDSTCPFWPGRKIRDTHLLVLIPATVGGAPLTLNLLRKLIQRPKNGGNATKYKYYSNKVKEQLGDKSWGHSYWLLMTRDVLEGSRGERYSAQKEVIANYVSDDSQPYEVPSALEAATAILMHHAYTGERLFGDNPSTYARCQEFVDGRCTAVVGNFEASGLHFRNNNCGSHTTGVAGCRKFKEGDQGVLSLRSLGEMEWKHYFGEVGPVPDFPNGMATILDSVCPFWPDKKVRDTHLLVLIPATVDGKPFTLNLLGKLIQHPKNYGHKTQYRDYDETVIEHFGEKSSDCSYWLLMTHDVLKDSRCRSYSAQSALIARYTGDDGQPYKMPSALEAATTILMHHVRTGERILSSRTYTRCEEEYGIHGKSPVVVGGFESLGPLVNFNYHDGFNICGVAGCRRF